jgi:hypothetical protein
MDGFRRCWQRSKSLSIAFIFAILLFAFGLSGPPAAFAQGEKTLQPADLLPQALESCQPITFGQQPLQGTISTAGEVDCFTFSGVAGHIIRVRVVETSSSLTPYHEISGVCSWTIMQEQDCMLVASGVHTIQVKDFAGANIGNYRIYVQDLSNPALCTPVSFGSTLAGTISVAAEADCFTFDGAANDNIRIRVIGTSGALTPYYDVISPDGTVLCTPTIMNEQDCVLVNSGRHTILVRDFAGANIGSYSIQVQRLNNPVGCTPISFGSTLAGTISVAAETDCFTFDGAANDNIRIRVVGASGALTPYYEVAASVSGGGVLCSPTIMDEQDCMLVHSGKHTVLVRDFAGPNTGNYSIYVQRLNNPVGCTSIAFSNVPRSGRVAVAAESDCYTFNGAAGDLVRIRVVKDSGTLVPYHEVVSTNGTVLCSPTIMNEQDCVPVNAGRHTILVRDFAGPNTGAYSMAIIFTHTSTYDGWVVRSVGARDGWVLESTETSNKGGSLNGSAATFQVGDDASDRQYRAVLSFNTAVLPDDATILSVVLKIRQQSVTGVNPFTAHRGLRVDLRKPFFGLTANLEKGDFQAQATGNQVGLFNPTPAAGWYSATLNGTGRNNINKAGITQLRLRFGRDDDDDRVADFIRFFSGSAAEALRPILIIKYLP